SLCQACGERALKLVFGDEDENPDPKKISLQRVIEAISRKAGISLEPKKRGADHADSLYPSDLYRESAENCCPILFAIEARCRRSVLYHVRSKTDPNYEAAFHLSCNRWSCTACALWKKQGWAERLFLGIQTLGADTKFYIWRGKASEWSVMRNRFR